MRHRDAAAAVYLNRRLPEALHRRSFVQAYGGHPGERHHGTCNFREPSQAPDVYDLHPEDDGDDKRD